MLGTFLLPSQGFRTGSLKDDPAMFESTTDNSSLKTRPLIITAVFIEADANLQKMTDSLILREFYWQCHFSIEQA